jgi:hypothetical protein
MKRVNVAVLLLVVLLVAGLGVTFLYRVRDSVNGVKCKNNLHQIGIGLHGYLDATVHFPRATVSNPDLPPEKRLSWMADVFPFLMGGYKSLLNNEKLWDDPENNPPRRQFRIYGEQEMREELYGDVEVFLCPARSHTTAPDSACSTDYVGITGVGAEAAELPLSDQRAGFFGYNRRIRLWDIKDGIAHTMAVTEVLDGGPWTAGGYATVRGLVADGRPYLGKGGQFTSLHGNSQIFAWSTATNVLFADASVRPFTSALSPEVFEAMATIAGGEKVAE